MGESLTYVYCIVHRARPVRMSRMPSGIPATARFALLQLAPRLWAVVSDVPADLYGRDRIDRRLRDLDWVAGIALAHEAVVERMIRVTGATVIPMKLFTIFSTPQRAASEMRQLRRDLEAVVKRIRGCDEWGMRVVRGAAAPAGRRGSDLDFSRSGRSASKNRDLTPGGPPVRSGAEFLAAKKQARDGARADQARQAAAAAAAVESLARVARETRKRPPPEAVAPPLAEAAFLVPRARNRRFRAIARQAGRACRSAGAELTLTGPWPAYNFVDAVGAAT